MDAFVLDVSQQFVLLQPIRDRLDLDGYDVVRVRDVSRIAPSPKHQLYVTALSIKHTKPVLPEGIDLRSLSGLLKSVDGRYPAMVINREIVAPASCEIGTLRKMTKTAFVLNWLNPLGEFEDDGPSLQLSKITRVQFGGEYENTLAEVARRRALKRRT